jgi:hypothetical protein
LDDKPARGDASKTIEDPTARGPFARGDVIVCSFVQGNEGNWITLAPDGHRCILDGRSKMAVDPRAPYVCTVKTTYKARDPTGKHGYIVRPDRPVTEADYNVPVDVDFDKHTIRFGLAYPTAFTQHKFADLRAERIEEAVGQGKSRKLLVHLKRNGATRTIEIGRQEALARGYRLNHFVDAPSQVIQPDEFPSQPGFQPSLLAHTGYLFEAPARLRQAAVAAAEADPELLATHARRRILAIAWTARLDPIPPVSAHAVQMEHALDYVARLVFADRNENLRRAKQAIAARRLPLLTRAQLALLANNRPWPVAYDAKEERVVMTLADFLDASKGHTDGDWDLRNRIVRDGNVVMRPHELATVLEARVSAVADGEAPAQLLALARGLRDEAEVPERQAQAPAKRIRVESFPPCIRSILASTINRQPLETEAFHVASFLHAAGYDAQSIHRCLSPNEPMPSESKLQKMTRRRSSPSFQPLPCDVARRMGLCRWECAAASTPHVTPVQVAEVLA